MFGSHCLKVVPVESVLSGEHAHQVQLADQLRLQICKETDSLISAGQLMDELLHLEFNSVQRLQLVTRTSLKDGALDLCNRSQ